MHLKTKVVLDPPDINYALGFVNNVARLVKGPIATQTGDVTVEDFAATQREMLTQAIQDVAQSAFRAGAMYERRNPGEVPL